MAASEDRRRRLSAGLMLLGLLFVLGAAPLLVVWLTLRGASAAPPTPTPASVPTATATSLPVPAAALAPTATPVAVVVVAPPPTATHPPTATPTATPIPTDTPAPTDTPTATLTATPSATPTPSPHPTSTPAGVDVLVALIPVAGPAPLPTASIDERAFLATSAAMMNTYAATVTALDAHMDMFDADPMILSYGDWVGQTRSLIDELRDLNAQAYGMTPPPRLAPAWGDVLTAVDSFAAAADSLEQFISLLEMPHYAAFRQAMTAGQAALARGVTALGL